MPLPSLENWTKTKNVATCKSRSFHASTREPASRLIGSQAMPSAPLDRILVIAATEGELAASAGWMTACCGVGPVDAAARTAEAVARYEPLAVVHVGIAGARRVSGLLTPQIVVGTETIYCDLIVPEYFAPSRLPVDPRLIDAACRALPSAVRRPIGTSGGVGRTSGCEVEAMEGFAVLRAAALAGVPAIEVRVISNVIEDTDRALWRFQEACVAVVAATPLLVVEIASCVS
jgi:futalosine hydrolase